MTVISKNVRALVNATVLSTGGYFRRQKWTHPVVAGNVNILAAVTLGAAAQTKTVFVAQPDFARTLRLKASGAADNGLVVTYNGTDIRGNVITEAVTIVAFGTAQDTVKAFKTVTSIVFPIEAGATNISIGYGAQLGLDRIVLEDSAVYSTVDTAKEATVAIISDGATISDNTVLFPTTLANTKNFVVGYFANEITLDSNTTA